MCKPKKSISRSDGFSTVELFLVVTLLGLLAGLIFPALDTMRQRAERTACSSNLRQIGVAVMQYLHENDQKYPKIEGDVTDPVYPEEEDAKPIGEVLAPYGVTSDVLKCPSDLKTKNNFAAKGTSYEWFPVVDGETATAPRIYLSSGVLMLPPARIPLASDFSGIHGGWQNVLFADGHVEAY